MQVNTCSCSWPVRLHLLLLLQHAGVPHRLHQLLAGFKELQLQQLSHESALLLLLTRMLPQPVRPVQHVPLSATPLHTTCHHCLLLLLLLLRCTGGYTQHSVT